MLIKINFFIIILKIHTKKLSNLFLILILSFESMKLRNKT